MILTTVWAFILAHWHKVVAVIAFGVAVYNKIEHNRAFNKMMQQSNNQKCGCSCCQDDRDKTTHTKHKKHKHKK